MLNIKQNLGHSRSGIKIYVWTYQHAMPYLPLTCTMHKFYWRTSQSFSCIRDWFYFKRLIPSLPLWNWISAKICLNRKTADKTRSRHPEWQKRYWLISDTKKWIVVKISDSLSVDLTQRLTFTEQKVHCSRTNWLDSINNKLLYQSKWWLNWTLYIPCKYTSLSDLVLNRLKYSIKLQQIRRCIKSHH